MQFTGKRLELIAMALIHAISDCKMSIGLNTGRNDEFEDELIFNLNEEITAYDNLLFKITGKRYENYE